MDENERRQLADKLSTTKEEKIVREIVRLGETFLAEQLKAALAADMRAMTLAAVLVATIAGLVGGTATIIAAKIDIGLHVISIVALCGCLVFSLFSAVRAARPTDFDYSGNNPKRWAPVTGDEENLIRALAVQASFYSQGIDNNSKVLRANHRCINRALGGVLVGIGAGVGIEMVVVLTLIGKYGVQAIL